MGFMVLYNIVDWAHASVLHTQRSSARMTARKVDAPIAALWQAVWFVSPFVVVAVLSVIEARETCQVLSRVPRRRV